MIRLIILWILVMAGVYSEHRAEQVIKMSAMKDAQVMKSGFLVSKRGNVVTENLVKKDNIVKHDSVTFESMRMQNYKTIRNDNAQRCSMCSSLSCASQADSACYCFAFSKTYFIDKPLSDHAHGL